MVLYHLINSLKVREFDHKLLSYAIARKKFKQKNFFHRL